MPRSNRAHLLSQHMLVGMWPIESPPQPFNLWSKHDMATASAKSKQLLAELAAKKTTKPGVKKPAPASKTAKVAPAPKVEAPKPVATKAPEPKAKKAAKPTEARVLYTIRLEPSLVDKLKGKGTKDGVTHAEVARNAIAAYFGA